MVSTVSSISNWCCEQLQDSMLPTKATGIQKAACYAYQFFKFALFLPLAAATSSLSFLLSLIVKPKEDSALVAFAKHPEWKEKREAAPVAIGFATADFQDNGPQGHPSTNWGQFYLQQGTEKLKEIKNVLDVWNHPEKVLSRLEELGVKKYRFSISRDKIEPFPGKIDQLALQHYSNFCKELLKRGIEPMATLHHFSDPTYFSWTRSSDIDGFVNYAKIASSMLYDAGVRKILTINEPTVVAFQGWVMGEFPPHHKLDFEGAAAVLENMMRAHARVYEELKKEHADFEIGLTHDPIRFRNFHKAHPLFAPEEKIIAHYLTEINHSALMRFFQTGKFTLKVPFCTNYSFSFEGKPPLDFIGLQYYSDPLLKLSLTNGESATRVAGEKLSSYQFRPYPQGLASVLEEFATLGIPIDLTEIGIDTGINLDDKDQERIRYFDRVFQVVEKAIEHGVPVRSLYFWTLIDNLEWYKAWGVRFGFYSFDAQTGKIEPRPVAKWLQDRIAARNHAAAVAG